MMGKAMDGPPVARGARARVHRGFQHPPVEEYLKVVYELEEEGVPVIRARLAGRLGHSGPTVTEVVRRLAADGLLETDKRALRLSLEGRRRAEAVVRKHRLAERLLADVVGLAWSKVHQEAERWEHVISDEVEQRLVVLLANPVTCPHGNPIPGSGGPRRRLRLLSGAVAGDEVVLEQLTEALEMDFDALAYLDSHGFRPGARAEVKERTTDGALTLAVQGVTLVVSPGLAAQLYVQER
jgi:DtxR family Mn-dependent transcriptional regulator